MNTFELPDVPGSYRWYYLDVSAGDFTAVIIFMVGSLFSPRYSVAHRKGARPQEHSAVNFALYERGVRRQWVLSEYPRAVLEDSGHALRIGRSTLRSTPTGLVADVVDLTALWGQPVHVHAELHREGPGHAPLRLVEGLEHWWHPIAPRARATLKFQHHTLEGRAYHDGNHGPVPLGSDLRGWDWVRTHTPERTSITYRPWQTGAPAWHVEVDAERVQASHRAPPPPPSSRTGWGLRVPGLLGEVDASPVLLESSPFYARLEAGPPSRHALGEVADFQRFHSPWVRWMAGLRTRVVQP